MEKNISIDESMKPEEVVVVDELDVQQVLKNLMDRMEDIEAKLSVDSEEEVVVEDEEKVEEEVVADEEEVKRNWEKLKLKEGKTSVLEGVPKSLPAMIKATRIQEKARGVGFDWDNQEQVWDKVKEELGELKVEIDKGAEHKAIEDEFGDVLFSMINYARFVDVDPEMALERTNKKFIKRFQYLEAESKKDGKELSDMSLVEMDEYWNAAKKLND